MQTPIRYTVVNQDGKPVIRAVPVPRRSVRPARRERQQAAQPEQKRHPFLRRLGFH